MERFKNGDRVCFVGDSITHHNIAVSHIVEYYRNNFPEENIEFYNCGISGGGLDNAIYVFDEDTAIYNPTHIVLMIGFNDSGIKLLAAENADEKYAGIEAHYEKYKVNIRKFYDIVTERGIKLILCTPVPYAEYQAGAIDVKPGGYALLFGYACFIKDFAKEMGLPLCDYHKALTMAMQGKKLYWDDATHPNEIGQYYMAKEFLAEQGLELGERCEISAAFAEWRAVVSKLRNIKAAEFRLRERIVNFDELTPEIQFNKVMEFYNENCNNAEIISPYFASLIKVYFEYKSKEDELIEFTKSFMSTNF